MIKGLAITPPVIGRISIGKLVQQGDRWLPEKDDAFTLTTQVQTRNGWLLHPLHRHYSEACGSGKLRTLPVRLPFNDSGLNLRAEYSAFDRRTGRRVGHASPGCAAGAERGAHFRRVGMRAPVSARSASTPATSACWPARPVPNSTISAQPFRIKSFSTTWRTALPPARPSPTRRITPPISAPCSPAGRTCCTYVCPPVSRAP